MTLWILLALLVIVLVALVVDRRLHQARIERESRELERLIEQRAAQRKFDSELALRLRAADAERQRTLEAARSQALLDQVQLEGILASAAEQSRQERDRNLSTIRTCAPAPVPDSRSDRLDCGGSSWSSSSDSSSSCDSSSSSGGGE